MTVETWTSSPEGMAEVEKKMNELKSILREFLDFCCYSGGGPYVDDVVNTSISDAVAAALNTEPVTNEVLPPPTPADLARVYRGVDPEHPEQGVHIVVPEDLADVYGSDWEMWEVFLDLPDGFYDGWYACWDAMTSKVDANTFPNAQAEGMSSEQLLALKSQLKWSLTIWFYYCINPKTGGAASLWQTDWSLKPGTYEPHKTEKAKEERGTANDLIPRPNAKTAPIKALVGIRAGGRALGAILTGKPVIKRR